MSSTQGLTLELTGAPIRHVRVERKVRAPHQAHSQQPSDNHTKYQTETGPPMRYPGLSMNK